MFTDTIAWIVVLLIFGSAIGACIWSLGDGE